MTAVAAITRPEAKPAGRLSWGIVLAFQGLAAIGLGLLLMALLAAEPAEAPDRFEVRPVPLGLGGDRVAGATLTAAEAALGVAALAGALGAVVSIAFRAAYRVAAREAVGGGRLVLASASEIVLGAAVAAVLVAVVAAFRDVAPPLAPSNGAMTASLALLAGYFARDAAALLARRFPSRLGRGRPPPREVPHER